MKTVIAQILILISFVSFGQELTTIRVSVPNSTDDVYIVGNQERLGNWQPEKIKMNKISEYEREISLNLTFPAEFKFTRGNWNSEAIINKLVGQPSFILKQKPMNVEYYKIQGWTDQIDEFSTFSEFKVIDFNSNILNQKRKLYVSLPENYNDKIKYPVIYVTDANNLNIFEIVNQTIRQQSNFRNFPECIVVGICINSRERNKELDIEYGENGKKFKNYIFNEIVPFINNNYSTSSFKAIFGHSNGAEYNHYLMLENDNPFDAFMNISENLTDLEKGKYEVIKNKFIEFLNTNKKQIKYFVASAKYDDPNRYPSGLKIEKIFAETPNNNVGFKHNVYRSWHLDLIGHSVLDAFNFIFSNYQDYSLFENQLNNKNFIYSVTKEEYLKQNKKYISPYYEGESSEAVIGEIIFQTKNPAILKQYFEYEDPENEEYSLFTRAILYFEINDLNEAILHLEKFVKENDESSIKQLNLSKAELYFEIYEKADKKELAYRNLETILKNNPDYDKGIKFILAKFGIEKNIQRKKSKKYLKQIEKSYTENRIFTLKDVEVLKQKIK
jgi:enterochelin esterase-like enzyme